MGLAVYMVAVLLLFIAVPCIFAFFYFLTLHRALNAVAPERRRMAPGLVWLAAIPGVNLIWCFFNGIEIPASVRSEYIARDLDDATDYGQRLGVANAVLNVANHFLACIWLLQPPGSSPWMGRMLSLATGAGIVAGLVVFFKFWIRIASYGEGLRTMDDADYPLQRNEYPRGVSHTEHAIQPDDARGIRPGP